MATTVTKSTPGFYEWTPDGDCSVVVEAWGGGACSSTTGGAYGRGKGGGGGAYAKSTVTCPFGQKAYMYVAPGGDGVTQFTGGASWFNNLVNTSPSSTTLGCLASGGSNTGAGGDTSDCKGTTKYAGGSGGSNNVYGKAGGGGCAGTLAAGTTASDVTQSGASAPGTAGGNSGSGASGGAGGTPEYAAGGNGASNSAGGAGGGGSCYGSPGTAGRGGDPGGGAGAHYTGSYARGGYGQVRYTYTYLAPQPAFTYTPTSGNAPLAVNFTTTSPASRKVTSRSWTFGDGGSSTATNPSHTYSAAGTYTVRLTETGPGGTAYVEHTVTAYEPNAPIAGFNYSPQSGYTPLAVNFTDTSTGTITSRSWAFGDGGTSTATNPSHTYTSHGTYTVTLTVTGPGGTDTQSYDVVVSATAPVAGFSSAPVTNTLQVNFTDTSTGTITSRSWTFGDGGTSTATNPSHTYSTPGTYSVTLTVTGPGGTNAITQSAAAWTGDENTVMNII